MAKRREVSGNYRMMVSALEECQRCFGTGIAIEHKPWLNQARVEIGLQICMCVRLVPILKSDGSHCAQDHPAVCSTDAPDTIE